MWVLRWPPPDWRHTAAAGPPYRHLVTGTAQPTSPASNTDTLDIHNKKEMGSYHPNSAFMMKAPSRAFTLWNLSRHYFNWVLKQCLSTLTWDACMLNRNLQVVWLAKMVKTPYPLNIDFTDEKTKLKQMPFYSTFFSVNALSTQRWWY